LIKFFSKLTALFYDKIISVSEYDREIAIKNKIAPANKLIAIHNGIDIENLSFLSKEQAQKRLLGRTSPLVIGTIAEWTKNKGLFYLLEAVKQLFRGRTPKFLGVGPLNNLDVILIGSGENPDKEKMYRFIKKHQFKNIHLIEFIPEAASYLKAFDVFVLPSIKEGLPYTILEAMLAEIPIIATEVGGIPEMIENKVNGLLIQPKNSQQLAEKINYLINNPEKARSMVQQARKKVITEFNLEKMVQKTKKVYF
jgi:glycosyltransferase involved in cell wall biosynthesis